MRPLRRRVAELGLGSRLALTRGPGARLRAALTVAGVAVAVAALLVAASVRHMVSAHDRRLDARAPRFAVDAGRLRWLETDTVFRGRAITGITLQQTRPVLVLLEIAVLVALLLPVGVFLATAGRFGGEERDRRLAALRLAALRLVGADRTATAWIVAGESLPAVSAGLIAGVVLFLALRPLEPHIDIAGVSVFAGDVVPVPGLAVLIAILVPVCAVAAAMAGMRPVVVEPLGVSRRGRVRRRRLSWRLLLPLAGFALLARFIGHDGELSTTSGQIEAAAGVLLALVGLNALLPWLVAAVVGPHRPGHVAGRRGAAQLSGPGGPRRARRPVDRERERAVVDHRRPVLDPATADHRGRLRRRRQLHHAGTGRATPRRTARARRPDHRAGSARRAAGDRLPHSGLRPGRRSARDPGRRGAPASRRGPADRGGERRPSRAARARPRQRCGRAG
ncbi:MAG: hypothetical protein ABSH51_27615 [Solirubrobacteraceae bacterium]